MIYSEDCLPGSCPLGISKHEKLLLQLYTVHVHVLALEENLVALDHWMTLFLGLAINFHLREDFWCNENHTKGISTHIKTKSIV